VEEKNKYHLILYLVLKLLKDRIWIQVWQSLIRKCFLNFVTGLARGRVARDPVLAPSPAARDPAPGQPGAGAAAPTPAPDPVKTPRRRRASGPVPDLCGNYYG
jgi:hypothetical protein